MGKAASCHGDLFRENKDVRDVFKDSLDADVVFVGTGNFERNSQSISRVYRHLGIDYETLARMKPKPVGDINLCFFDRGGNDLTPDILRKLPKGSVPKDVLENGTFFPEDEDCHGFLVGMNLRFLKKMVRNDKTVVLVAGDGGCKTDAIYTCLRAGIVNALVTDNTTMESLLTPERIKGMEANKLY